MTCTMKTVRKVKTGTECQIHNKIYIYIYKTVSKEKELSKILKIQYVHLNKTYNHLLFMLKV